MLRISEEQGNLGEGLLGLGDYFERELQRSLQRMMALLEPIVIIVTGLMIAIMVITFIEFQIEWSMGTLIASYTLAYLFLVVSPTPSGMGIVEGILPLAMAGLGIPLGDAIVVTLSYRAVTFWIPLLLGGISLRILERQN